MSAERAVVTFVTVRLAADIAVDNWHCGCTTWTANNARDSCLVLTIICLAAVISIVVGRQAASGELQPVTVMTRNLYLGGDINRPIRAALDRSGQEGVLDLGHANHELRQVVDRTNFKSRSKLLVEEIAAAARPARPPGGRALASDPCNSTTSAEQMRPRLTTTFARS